MAIYVWVVDKGGALTTEMFESQSEFNLMENRGIYYHLRHLWEKVSKETGMPISDIEDTFYEQSELFTFLDLVNHELLECEKIPVDEWIFCSDTEIIKTINGELYTPDKYDSVKAYVAEWFVKSYEYAVVSAVKENLTIEVRKHLQKVSKSELRDFLTELKTRITQAVEHDKRLFLSYG